MAHSMRPEPLPRRAEKRAPNAADRPSRRHRGREARADETLDAVLALPEKYKTCVYLFYYEGYRTAEIAALTGVPSSTVRSHLSEARALLKTMLGGERHGR